MKIQKVKVLDMGKTLRDEDMALQGEQALCSVGEAVPFPAVGGEASFCEGRPRTSDRVGQSH